jgi:S-adenosylmethionine-dependent methyltransferase
VPTKSADTNFDGIATKFDNNIYGTTKGRLRNALLIEQLQGWLPKAEDTQVLDLGGGTGEMSKFLLEQGYSVVLNDISEESLTLAGQRLSEFDKLTLNHGDLLGKLEGYSPRLTSDLVICHAVLEWTIKPQHVIQNLSKLVKPNGILSLSFFNRDAALFANAIYGNFDYIASDLKAPKQVKLNPQNPQKPNQVIKWLTESNFAIEQTSGVRCVHDYMRDLNHQQQKYNDLLSLETQLAYQEPYKWLGRYFHIIARNTTA